VSIRRACATFLIDASLYHYKSKRGDQAALKARIKGLPRRGCATATVVSMCCCAVRDGL
jgi:hypothetical protein